MVKACQLDPPAALRHIINRHGRDFMRGIISIAFALDIDGIVVAALTLGHT